MTDPSRAAFADFEALVRTYGWAIRHVLGDASRAPFSYTGGLTGRGFPELIVTGLPHEVADVFIRNAVDEQQASGPFRASTRTRSLTESGEVVFVRVDDASGMTATHELLGDFESLQLVWPDSSGRLPWESGWRNAPGTQPLLGDLLEQ